jgi:hypothetical protein
MVAKGVSTQIVAAFPREHLVRGDGEGRLELRRLSLIYRGP